MFRSIVSALILACLISAISPFLAAAAVSLDQLRDLQTVAAQADDAAGAAEAARELSLLEADRAFDELYERMHPDALAVVPRSAVVGWYESFFAGRETDELTVTDVVFEPWTWGVTGAVYDDAVTVQFIQPYSVDGVADEVEGEVHLVPFDDDWAWFFGASRAFVDEQIALHGDDGSATLYSLEQESAVETPVAREALFPDPLHAHVDQFWAARFQEAGQEYDPPDGVVPFDAPIVTACGRADPNLEAAFYCVIDEKIYYSAEFRSLIESQIGDFAWVIVVAHEWGHHIQAQLGFDLGVVPDRAGEVPPIELEQQADCLAGAYAIDAELTGWLDAGDIDEALYMTRISGDPTGTAWNDPRAHGTGDERIDAFLTGYSGGLPDCDLDLTGGDRVLG
ncbi:MAG: neutral zinc metallopeptidase [Thermomicrobiales bacterium]